MITEEELDQLRTMARLDNNGRLGTHELLSKLLLRVIDRIEASCNCSRCNICGGLVRYDGTKPEIKSMR